MDGQAAKGYHQVGVETAYPPYRAALLRRGDRGVDAVPASNSRPRKLYPDEWSIVKWVDSQGTWRSDPNVAESPFIRVELYIFGRA